jgi:hypothetical protein
VDANAVAAWEAAYKARMYNRKANTAAATRANIIEKEAMTFDALTALLSDAGDAAARLISVQATPEDTNGRLRELQRDSVDQARKITELHALFTEGRLPHGLTDEQNVKLVRSVKGALTGAREEATSNISKKREEAAETKAKAKEDRASRMTAAAEQLALAAESIKDAKLKMGKAARERPRVKARKEKVKAMTRMLPTTSCHQVARRTM